MAFISSSVYCEARGSSPLESTPPVAQTLITSAPYLMISRTLCCTPSTPSAAPSDLACHSYGRRFWSQWPPVIESAGPLASGGGRWGVGGVRGGGEAVWVGGGGGGLGGGVGGASRVIRAFLAPTN